MACLLLWEQYLTYRTACYGLVDTARDEHIWESIVGPKLDQPNSWLLGCIGLCEWLLTNLRSGTHTKQHVHGCEQGILSEGSTIQEVNVESYIKYF